MGNAINPLKRIQATQQVLTSCTVLIVDDDQDCRSLLRDTIDELGQDHKVIEFSNGRDATDYLFRCDESSRPDLIFLDMEMPLMAGLETLEMIKAHPRLKQIPVIILSGVTEKDMMERAAMLGANSYTVKSSSSDQFLQTLTASAHYWLTVHRYPRKRVEEA